MEHIYRPYPNDACSETPSGHHFNEATKVTHRPLLLPDLIIPDDHPERKLKPLGLQDIPLDKLQALHPSNRYSTNRNDP
ncbi:hypothetical protein JTB14_005353 [Gonioctena quinquepunctata]|nr:hypothetical protein JTB14_005353 [Gonioctena quinquepunctata]